MRAQTVSVRSNYQCMGHYSIGKFTARIFVSVTRFSRLGPYGDLLLGWSCCPSWRCSWSGIIHIVGGLLRANDQWVSAGKLAGWEHTQFAEQSVKNTVTTRKLPLMWFCLLQNAYNCWIAALLYLITLAVSAHQFWLNNRSSLSV